jgi:hypothetical protein
VKFCVVAVTASALLVLGACAVPRVSPKALQSGLSEADVQARFGTPSGRHALPGGGVRLEYATGPMGRETWMIDLDAQGRVSGWHQALEEARLHAFQARAPGLAIDELLRTLGRPAERHGVARVAGRPGEIWSWRYVTNECLWYQVSIARVDPAPPGDSSPFGGQAGQARPSGQSDSRRVVDAGFGIDPRCDMRDSSRSTTP